MKTFFAVLTAMICLNASAFAIDASYEALREEKLAHAADEIDFLDNATPDEIAAEFGFQPELNIPDFNIAAPGATSAPSVTIDVSISRQSLTIRYPGGGYSTAISSGRSGFATRTGCYSRPRLERMHYSRKYENAPMPHSMFYYGGFAIHGTYDERNLGRPASHGCVRVSLSDAARLFGIVQRFGAKNTRICVR